MFFKVSVAPSKIGTSNPCVSSLIKNGGVKLWFWQIESTVTTGTLISDELEGTCRANPPNGSEASKYISPFLSPAAAITKSILLVDALIFSKDLWWKLLASIR